MRIGIDPTGNRPRPRQPSGRFPTIPNDPIPDDADAILDMLRKLPKMVMVDRSLRWSEGKEFNKQIGNRMEQLRQKAASLGMDVFNPNQGWEMKPMSDAQRKSWESSPAGQKFLAQQNSSKPAPTTPQSPSTPPNPSQSFLPTGPSEPTINIVPIDHGVRDPEKRRQIQNIYNNFNNPPPGVPQDAWLKATMAKIDELKGKSSKPGSANWADNLPKEQRDAIKSSFREAILQPNDPNTVIVDGSAPNTPAPPPTRPGSGTDFTGSQKPPPPTPQPPSSGGTSNNPPPKSKEQIAADKEASNYHRTQQRLLYGQFDAARERALPIETRLLHEKLSDSERAKLQKELEPHKAEMDKYGEQLNNHIRLYNELNPPKPRWQKVIDRGGKGSSWYWTGEGKPTTPPPGSGRIKPGVGYDPINNSPTGGLRPGWEIGPDGRQRPIPGYASPRTDFRPGMGAPINMSSATSGPSAPPTYAHPSLNPNLSYWERIGMPAPQQPKEDRLTSQQFGALNLAAQSGNPDAKRELDERYQRGERYIMDSASAQELLKRGNQKREQEMVEPKKRPQTRWEVEQEFLKKNEAQNALPAAGSAIPGKPGAIADGKGGFSYPGGISEAEKNAQSQAQWAANKAAIEKRSRTSAPKRETSSKQPGYIRQQAYRTGAGRTDVGFVMVNPDGTERELVQSDWQTPEGQNMLRKLGISGGNQNSQVIRTTQAPLDKLDSITQARDIHGNEIKTSDMLVSGGIKLQKNQRAEKKPESGLQFRNVDGKVKIVGGNKAPSTTEKTEVVNGRLYSDFGGQAGGGMLMVAAPKRESGMR